MGATCCKCLQIKPVKGMPEDLRSKIYSYLLQVTYRGRGKKFAVNPYVKPKLRYKRATEFDSNYVSVWDGPDPTSPMKKVRVIACRGTEIKWTHPIRSVADAYEDAKTYAKGFPDDLIHFEMLRIMKATPKGVTIDVCAHSLGTSLVLETYMKALKIEDRVRRTYLFNPVYSLFKYSGKTSEISRLFEDNIDCRWFLNTADIVSVEGQDRLLGGRWPKNVTLNVGKQPPFLHILGNHHIAQWNGRVAIKHPKNFVPPSRQNPAGNRTRFEVTSPSRGSPRRPAAPRSTRKSSAVQQDSEATLRAPRPSRTSGLQRQGSQNADPRAPIGSKLRSNQA